MFRKIHSKRDPGDTLFSALGKEFRVYTDLFKDRLYSFLRAYPKAVYAFMVISILVSAVLTITVFKSGKSGTAVDPGMTIRHSGRGLSKILSTADALRESLEIKREITILIAKDSLSKGDSLRLEKALDRFHQLTITHSPHEQN